MKTVLSPIFNNRMNKQIMGSLRSQFVQPTREAPPSHTMLTSNGRGYIKHLVHFACYAACCCGICPDAIIQSCPADWFILLLKPLHCLAALPGCCTNNPTNGVHCCTLLSSVLSQTVPFTFRIKLNKHHKQLFKSLYFPIICHV